MEDYPPQPMQGGTPVYGTVPVAPTPRRSLKLGWLKQARAYLAEYAVMLIVLATLLFIATSMFGGIIDYIGGHRPSSNWWWSDRFAYTASISKLASIIVLVPLFFLFSRRTGGSEDTDTGLKNLTWRKAFLGIFLVIIMLSAISSGVAFVYTLLSKLASAGLVTDEKVTVWRGLVKYAFSALLFTFTGWLYSRDYRSQANLPVLLGKLHRYALVFLLVVLAAVYSLIPLKAQRGAFIDQVITDDLRTLRTEVEKYSGEKGTLPNDLSDLDLSDTLEAHASAYHYAIEKGDEGDYRLCAEFHTNTKDKKSVDANPLERYSAGSDSSIYPYPGGDDDPAIHGKGRQCFTYQNYYIQYDDNFFEQPGSSDLQT